MTLHVDNELSDYWSMKDMTPKHPMTKDLSRDRFQELHIRVRFHGKDVEGPYAKVSIFDCLLP